jgi:hypothetical protein
MQSSANRRMSKSTGHVMVGNRHNSEQSSEVCAGEKSYGDLNLTDSVNSIMQLVHFILNLTLLNGLDHLIVYDSRDHFIVTTTTLARAAILNSYFHVRCGDIWCGATKLPDPENMVFTNFAKQNFLSAIANSSDHLSVCHEREEG